MQMEMPGQTWSAAGAAFLGMWTVMTAAMMLPSLVPMLVRYRRDVVGASVGRAGILVLLVALSYFGVWVAIGVLVFPFSTVVGRLHPLGVCAILGVAVGYQFTGRKARDLACCRRMLVTARALDPDVPTALRAGFRYGVHCVRCCGNLMVIPFVLGSMSVGVMVLVGAVIALERVWTPAVGRMHSRLLPPSPATAATVGLKEVPRNDLLPLRLRVNARSSCAPQGLHRGFAHAGGKAQNE